MSSEAAFGDANAGLQAGNIYGNVSTSFQVVAGGARPRVRTRRQPRSSGERLGISKSSELSATGADPDRGLIKADSTFQYYFVACLLISTALSGLGWLSWTFYPELERVLTASDAQTEVETCTLPFGRDEDFVERANVFEGIEQRLHAVPTIRTALVGLGGVGKSQIAIEFAYRTRERSPDTWVFWIHGSNTARLEQGFRAIASCAKIPGWQASIGNIYQLVHDWLQDNCKRGWVIVFDNVDDARVLLDEHFVGANQQSNDFRSQGSQPIWNYIPQCKRGSVLITSRSRDAARHLVEDRHIIPIEPMTANDAEALLQKKLSQKEDNQDIANLAAALEHMPLAIVQSATYINQRRPRYSIQRYLTEFRRSDRDKANLLERAGSGIRRDREAKNSIIVTWQMSFDHIRSIRPSAADLLALMSVCDGQGIPEMLVNNSRDAVNHQNGIIKQIPMRLEDHGPITSGPVMTMQPTGPDGAGDKNTELQGEAESIASRISPRDEFEDDVRILRDYSFISTNSDGRIFQIHALVQLATREWLDMHKQLEFWKGRLVHNLLAAFPEGTVESVDWTTCRILFPHVQLAVAQPPAEDSAMIDWVKILNVAADYAITRRDISEEIRLLEQAVLTLRENVGPAREETLAATNDLAVAYINEQYYDASESLLLEALQETKTTLGPEHTESLISMAWLSRVYFLQGHLEAAYNLQMDVLNLCHQKMATNLPRISACILGILYVYRDQGQYDQGVLLLSEALTASIGSLGPHHHVTLTYRILLGQLYSLQGNWEAAVSVLEGLLDIQSAMLGADHPVTLGCLGALAWEYLWHAKRYDEAGSMYWQLVEEYKTLFGEDHLDTIKTLDALARALEGQGKYGDAEIMGQRALEGLERAYGDDNHPKILKRLESQASVLWHLGKYDEAMILADRAMWGRRRVLGDKHPDTLECIWTKANMLRSTRQLGEAYHVFSVAMDGYRSLLEPDHPTMQAFMKDYREYWKEVEQTQAQPNFELLHGPPEEEVSVWNYILAALIILAHAENW